MQKVYLLLRSNKQTGPYSLEELLQLNLKPFDLVWVEGRTAAWQYPFEIPALKPYVPETPHAEVPFKPIATAAMEEKLSQVQNPDPQKTEIPKKVFVSVPKNFASTSGQKADVSQNSYQEHKAFMPPVSEPLQERKEDIKQPASSHSQPSPSYSQKKPVEEDIIHTNYSRSLTDVEEEYTSWIYKQKTKKKSSVNPKDLVLAVLILAVIGGGYYVMSKPSVANSVLPANKIATQTIQQPKEKSSEESEPKEILSPDQRMVSNTDKTFTSTPAESTKIKKKENPVTVSKSQTNSSVPKVQNSMPVEKTNPNIHNDNNDISSKDPEVKQQPKENVPVEKKKKFGDVIKDIFSKKNKKEEPKNDQVVLEDPKPANNRQATRREEDDNSSINNSGSNEISMASLMEQVDLSSNAPDNWMMGVKNLKITLRNRNNVTLQTASVMVNYYDENNRLLEKKLVYFNNVPPKAKATVAAPDHKFADHVDFKLTTVSAKEDRYAKY
jgi:hypothetical protein